MAKGMVKTWNGCVAKIVCDEYEQHITAEAAEFKIGIEPSIGDELSFTVKKYNQNGEVVLYAKKIQFTNANPHMLSADEKHKNTLKQLFTSILSVIVLVLAAAGIAYYGYHYYQQQQMEKQFMEMSDTTILSDNE